MEVDLDKSRSGSTEYPEFAYSRLTMVENSPPFQGDRSDRDDPAEVGNGWSGQVRMTVVGIQSCWIRGRAGVQEIRLVKRAFG